MLEWPEMPTWFPNLDWSDLDESEAKEAASPATPKGGA